MTRSDDPASEGIGAPRQRVEDLRLVRGQGRFVDDIVLPGMAHAVLVTSTHAHALIKGIAAEEALAAPGVLLVLTGEDVSADGLGGLPCRAYVPPPVGHVPLLPPHPILAQGRVRHVGDRVALVVAETRQAARDAAELVTVDYEPLPAVLEPQDALKAGAPPVWDTIEGNLGFALKKGDAAAVTEAFARAAHVVSIHHRYPRIAGTPLEPRVAIGDCSAQDGRYTLYTATQQPHRIREVVAREVLHIAESELRVVAPDVGGGFGTKGSTYPEEALVVWAAGKLKRPVKWTGDRAEALAADMAGRDHVEEAELALAADGTILACRLSATVNLGAYLVFSAGIPMINVANLTCGYRIPAFHAAVRTAFTHTAPVGPYRGTGRPETNFVVERLLDLAAEATGLDPAEIRRRNLITAADIPAKLPGGTPVADGDFRHMLEEALDLADHAGFAERRRASAAAGRLRGFGIGCYAVLAGSAVQSERMDIRVDRDGGLVLHAGTQASGQGHETAYAQMLASWLGVPAARIRVVQGDTDRVMFGRGSFAARSMMLGGTALRAAADQVIDRGRRFASLMLEAAVDDIEFDKGRFRIVGSDRAVTLAEVAQRSTAYAGNPLDLGVGLDGSGGGLTGATVPNGCLICEVEVDAETGAVTIERIASADDIGVVINPLTATGQVHGAIGQAVGEALTEQLVYDPASGQLLTGSFMDYGMPRADLFGPIVNRFVEVPATTNPLGVKGGSELGSSGLPAALGNAVLDALRPLGVTDLSLPMTPQKVWQAIQDARTA